MSDGFVLGAAVKLIPMAKLLRKYDSDLKDVRGFNIEPFPLDMAFINQSDKSIWDEQVAIIQNGITDEIIDRAFNQVPNEVKDEKTKLIKEL
jgi:hypothetical protein